MTTQREVVDAFANGDTEPRRASNLRIRQSESGTRAYLVGGGNAVYAKREPINRVVAYTDWRNAPYQDRRETDLTSIGLRRQARRIFSMLPMDIEYEERDSHDEEKITPLADDIEALQ